MTTPTDPEPAVTRSDSDGVATVTLRAPGLTGRSRRELLEVLRGLSTDDDVRAVLLTGSGRAFCVGQDLTEHVEALRRDPATAMDVVRDSYNPIALALAAVRVPVLVAINGACVGAGLGLAMGGDLRIAAAGAKFGTAFTGIGLSSDSALATRLVQALGVSRATELLLLPEPFSAETALHWGLVHRVVDPAELLTEARTLAVRLAQGPTAAYRAVKTVLATAATDTLADTLTLEAELQSELGRTADHREAVEAFLAKRPPAFTGR